MTLKFNVKYQCSYCNNQTTAESGFSRWMRNERSLDSKQGIVVTDLDYIVLRYETHPQGREFQLMMFVEVKEFGSMLTKCQRDILSLFQQLTVSKTKNIHGSRGIRPKKIHSKMKNSFINLKFFGIHLLQFEQTNPMDSEWIKWNNRKVGVEKLIEILNMKVHPELIYRSMDEFLRDHHKQNHSQIGMFK